MTTKKLTKIDAATVRLLRPRIEALLAPMEEEYGVKVRAGSGKFGDTHFSLTVEFARLLLRHLGREARVGEVPRPRPPTVRRARVQVSGRGRRPGAGDRARGPSEGEGVVNYETACAEAATDQGLDGIVQHLKGAGIEVEVEQTGGFCMVATVYVRRPGLAYIGITNEGSEDDPEYLVVPYADEEDAEGGIHRIIRSRDSVRLAVQTMIGEAAETTCEGFNGGPL